MLHHISSPRRLGVAIAGLLALASPFASAETGSASAQDLSVHINLLGVAQLDVDAQAPVQIDHAVTATVAENSSPGIDTGGVLLHLGTGVLNSDAEYAPREGISAAGARTSVADLDLTAVGLLGDGLVSIQADLIQSRSMVTGYCLPARPVNRDMFEDIGFYNGFDNGNLDAGGPNGHPSPDDVVLGGLHISILGIEVPDLPLNPAPNTDVDLSVLGIVGATLILNEQTQGGDGVNSASLSSNAVHLTLNVAGLVTADVVIGHSDASLDCTQ